MTEVLRCKGCQSALRMRTEYVGKKLRCPRCQTTMSVRSFPEEEPAEPAVEMTELSFDDPPPLPEEEYATTAEEPVEYEEPPRRRRRREDEDDEDEGSEWVPCPRCGAQHSVRVMWTFWGSFYGPALFNHVECPECGKTYNGRNGRPNFIPALIFTLIPLLLIVGLIGVVTWIILARQF